MASPSIILTLTITTMLYILPSAFSQVQLPFINFSALAFDNHGDDLDVDIDIDADITNAVGVLNNASQSLTVLVPITPLPTAKKVKRMTLSLPKKMSNKKKWKLATYHVLPKYYSLEDLAALTNPVPTMARGDHGTSLCLNFTCRANQVITVSTGVVKTRITRTLRKGFPLAMYAVDKVLWPLGFHS